MPEGSWQARRVGMSRNANVAPLHSKFQARLKGSGRQIKIAEPEDVAAPPMSDSSSDDDEATSRRGDMQRTAFGTKPSTNGGNGPTYGTRRSSRTASQPVSRPSPKRPREDSDNEEIDEPAKKIKAVGRKDDGLGSHFKTDAFQRKTVGLKASYGTQKKTGYSRSATLLSKSAFISEDFSSPEKPKPAYKPVDSPHDLSTPEKPRSRFVLPDAGDGLSTPSPKKGFKAPDTVHTVLDTPSPVKPFKVPAAVGEPSVDSSPEQPRAKTENAKTNADDLIRRARLERKEKKAEKEERLRRRQELESDSPKADFKTPAELGPQDDLGSQSDVDVDVLEESAIEEFKPAHDTSPCRDEPVCPMCGEVVDQSLLDKFGKKTLMNITHQHRFCNYHKASTARQTWVDKGYPDINWSKLDDRIAKHYDFLENILNGGASHYGTLFGKSVKAGKNKTLLKTDRNLTPGYYGSRGSRVMTENLIDRFSLLLRKVAVQDRLVSARGHTAFVQFVLVPELAVRLIMEDMDVPAERARTIMEESVVVGDLLNEEEDDVIVNDEKELSGGESTSSLSSLGDEDLSDGTL